jgi:hypothetical protein
MLGRASATESSIPEPTSKRQQQTSAANVSGNNDVNNATTRCHLAPRHATPDGQC